MLEVSEKCLNDQEPVLRMMPASAMQMMIGLDIYLGPPTQIFIVEGKDSEVFEEALEFVRKAFIPQSVLGAKPKKSNSQLIDTIPPLHEKMPIDGRTSFYVCEGFTCDTPLNDFGSFKKLIESKMISRG